jgi:hypothetical protein
MTPWVLVDFRSPRRKKKLAFTRQRYCEDAQRRYEGVDATAR